MSEPALPDDAAPDDVVDSPRRSKLPFPVVGLGASAGGLEAALRFFEQLPSDSGMAFVVVFHLAPEHESVAAQILQRATRMPVMQVAQTVSIEPNHVYVIAPGLQLAMDDGHLQVSALHRTSASRAAVDVFFRTLALAHGERAFAVVLSGAGSDGAVGLADVKREGGVTFAQSPDDAEHDGMPAAAIATQLVDFVLPAAEIPAKLIDLWRNACRIRLPGGKDVAAVAHEPRDAAEFAQAEAAVRDVLTLVRSRTGNDFQHYKRATILRRIERRMQVTAQPDLMAYRDYLERHPEETEPLLHDLLISVTSFFRDRQAFEALERELMTVLQRRPPAGVWRCWVAGCATGEEAYSLAMLIDDHLPRGAPVPVQIFATDIDERALARARQGTYPDGIVTDLSPIRLREYFQAELDSFRIKRAVREQITFSRHNVLRDPPFSRMDLICCRNLLIYLEREVQARLLEIFHFALNPGGLLFLGSAETADARPGLFSTVDKRARVYRANPVERIGAESLALRLEARPTLVLPSSPPARRSAAAPAPLPARQYELQPAACLVVDREQHIVYVSGGASEYLRAAEGIPSRDVLEMIHPDLADALRPALLRCIASGTRVAARPVRINGAQGPIVRMSVQPGGSADLPATFNVLIDVVDEDLAPPLGEPDPALTVLKAEAARLRGQLDGALGESASSTEGLRASNEELQSMNEELRCATEELEAGKEELHSLNEELTTVNYELRSQVEETAKANDDLTNLIVSLDIATVFVDRGMRIKRFTPRAMDVFNIRAADIGRPLPDLTHRLRYDGLAADIGKVISNLQTLEQDVEDSSGRCYLMRISPYRTAGHRIDGVVLSLIDETERRRAQQQLRAHDERLRAVAGKTKEFAIITLDPSGCITTWNVGAELMFGYAEAEILGEHFRCLFTPEERVNGVPERELQTALQTGRVVAERWCLRKDGSRFFCGGSTTPIDDGAADGVAIIVHDLTEHQRLDKQRDDLLLGEKRVREQLEAAHALRSEFLAILSHELKNPLNLILMNAELIARTQEGAQSPKVIRAVDVIRRTVRSQSQIIDDLLDLSRLHTGKLALTRTALPAKPVVERILDGVRQEAASKQIELASQVDDLVVYADGVRLEQIVWNLVANALKFTPGPGRIVVRLGRDGSYARLEVQDTGIGIERSMIDTLFGMFSQGLGSTTTRRDDGLGIGLALVKQLAELHDGRVEAQSEGAGKGACFTVWLPLSEGRLGGRGQSSGTTLYGRRVLIVEDDPETL